MIIIGGHGFGAFIQPSTVLATGRESGPEFDRERALPLLVEPVGYAQTTVTYSRFRASQIVPSFHVHCCARLYRESALDLHNSPRALDLLTSLGLSASVLHDPSGSASSLISGVTAR